MYSKDINDVYKELDTSEKGLTINEVNKRLNIYDKNIIKEKKKGNIFLRFFKQFKDIMIIILLVVALLLYIYGRLYSHEYTDTIVILVVVFINAVTGFIQEEKANSVIDGLKKYEASTCKVKRNGKIYKQEYEKGKTVTPLTEIGTSKHTGSKSTFWPDPEIFL